MTMRHAIIVALAMTTAAPLGAQRAIDSARSAAIERIPRGMFVRVEIRDSVYTGKLVGHTRTDLVIRRHNETFAVPQTYLRSLSYSKGRATKKGAIIGGVTLGVPGALLGAIANSFMCSSSNCDALAWQGAAMGALAGAGTGAVIGAGIGSMFVGWKQAWP